MADRKTIMSWLEGLAQDDWHEWHSDSEVQTTAQAALELLEAQEPKAIEYHDNPFTGLPVAHCPNCKRYARQFHSSVEEETHYCPWFGQAVKWE